MNIDIAIIVKYTIIFQFTNQFLCDNWIMLSTFLGIFLSFCIKRKYSNSPFVGLLVFNQAQSSNSQKKLSFCNHFFCFPTVKCLAAAHFANIYTWRKWVEMVEIKKIWSFDVWKTVSQFFAIRRSCRDINITLSFQLGNSQTFHYLNAKRY